MNRRRFLATGGAALSAPLLAAAPALALPIALPDLDVDFSGIWETTYGVMRLSQTGASVTGTYAYSGGSTISGTVSGRTFTFTYTEPGGTAGAGVFTLAADSASFSGTWKPKSGAGGNWTGKRAGGTPPIEFYLVVLEAHWESSLTDPEYSFGAMLRAFFTRVPTVAVRQRYFHDEDNLRRFCREIAYLPAPTVVYLSTHGSPSGVSVGGKTIAPQVIGESLKGASNLSLLHLGSCQLMAGDGPKAIRESSGANFPISGYQNVADWGGSAAIDFLYLDLILARGIAPAKAVAQTRAMLSIATDKTAPDAPVAPCDLRIF